jgi:hypothetical protein
MVESLRDKFIVLLPLVWVVVKLVEIYQDVIVLLNHDTADFGWIIDNH